MRVQLPDSATGIDRLAQGVLKPMNPYVSSLMGALTLLWGLMVINPFTRVFEGSPAFTKAMALMPEEMWGMWAVAVGLTILAGAYLARSRLLCFGLGAAVWHWFTIAGMSWWGNPTGLEGITYTFVGLYSVTAYLNVRVNYVRRGIKRI